MSTVLASEASRQKARRKAYEQENQAIVSMLRTPDRLRSLAENVSLEDRCKNNCFKSHRKCNPTPISRNGFVNKAFNGGVDKISPPYTRIHLENPDNHELSERTDRPPSYEDVVDHNRIREMRANSSHKRLENPSDTSKKRVYVTQPPQLRRSSVDNNISVTVFSSEKGSGSSNEQKTQDSHVVNGHVQNVRLRRPQNDMVDCVNRLDRRDRILSYPSPAYDSWYEELKYWRMALKTSSRLKALEK